jgi:glyoxylase-like metal-dependent hydrolase (beta-lactamase superfamily II)
MKRPTLPPQMHVFVRDWLSANHVVLRSDAGCVVVDSGYDKHVPLMLALIASRMGLDGRPLAKLVNTHCHSDHVGGNAALRRAYGCTIAVPAGEAPLIDAWDERALLYEYADQRAERFAVDEILVPGSTHTWGDIEWRALAAPGHAMGALVFFNDEHRILISGDALWQNGYGIVMPPELDPGALPATRATLEMIATLDARCVVPGHGEPFTDVGRGARARLRAHRRVRSRSDAHRAPRAEGAARVLAARPRADAARVAAALRRARRRLSRIQCAIFPARPGDARRKARRRTRSRRCRAARRRLAGPRSLTSAGRRVLYRQETSR